MTILAWIIMGAVAGAIIFLLLTLYFLAQIFFQSQKLKRLPKRPPKNKKKRRRWTAAIARLKQRRKRALLFVIVLLISAVACGGGAGYASYYQSINLSSGDSALIVRSYYLLRDFKAELTKAAQQEETEVASQQNIRYLATTLAAYSTKKASTVNTPEGQSALNRYYASLSELGMNATMMSGNFYGNGELAEEFLADIEKTITYETTAFEYYKVNQSELEEEGASEDE
ncbi:hypothetical protein IW492_03285 [Enterococcus sp. BWB1-3]|uniref:hypothetical protein n=1 Tax=Enterococcus sp. BWB1-3 TaxID=2787713 RepID=UPI001924B791|nr:hypothetical protein [Enterococcus sp. BWB1-3]MBL1228257.1 hypothetical protein [Enterococcus sp. BWB1-3]